MAKHPTVTLPRDTDALKAAADLLEQADQKPAAWVETREDGSIYWGCETDTVISDDPSWLDRPVPVYFAPPPRKPLDGAAKTFQAMIDALQAGDSYESVLRQFGYMEVDQPEVWVTPKLRPLAKLAHERKSLSDEEIKRMAAKWFLSMYWPLCNTFAREIEASHGIKE